MTKKSIRVAAGVMSALTVVGTATPALAASTNVNSIGSVAGDIAHIGNDGAQVHTDDVNSKSDGVTGYDASQKRESEYAKIALADAKHPATQAEVDADRAQTVGQIIDNYAATQADVDAGLAKEVGDIVTDGVIDDSIGNPSDTNPVNRVDVYATQKDGTDLDTDNDGTPDVEGDVEVLIPKVIIVDGSKYVSDPAVYTVKAKGNIAGDEHVEVLPKTNATHTANDSESEDRLDDVSGADRAAFWMGQAGKADIPAKVTQQVIKFAGPTATIAAGDDVQKSLTTNWKANGVKGSETTGTVTVGKAKDGNAETGITAGRWHGTFTFDIKVLPNA